MASNDLQLVIRAVDQASSTLSKVQNDLRQFSSGAEQQLNRVTRSSAGAAKGLQTLLAAGVGAQGLSAVSQGLGKAVQASNQMQSALMGLSSVASAFGSNVGAANAAAQQLASDGLMSVNQAATGLKNLLAAGFNLDQAVTLMQRFKDSAAFGRQSALTFGDAVASATEGIKNGNSILVDNAGVTKNLSIMLEEAGFSAQDLMRASTDAGVRQAIFSGIVRETNAQLGDSVRLSGSAAGQQARLGTALSQAAARAGDLVNIGLSPMAQAAANFVIQNQQMIVSLGLAAAAAVGFGAVVISLVGAIGLAVTVLGGPLTIALAAVSVLLGGVVFAAAQKLQKQIGSTFGQFATGSQGIRSAADKNFPAAGKQAEDLAKKLKDIGENIIKANRDFRQSLADILKTSQDKIADLKKQTADENNAFQRAQDEKKSSFEQAQSEIARRHEETVADIQQQLDEEIAKGRFANQQAVQSLQQRLQRERDDFSRSTAEKQAEYQKDTGNAQTEHQKKLMDLQAQLQQETDFLNKHSATLKGIRASDALDQIQRLKQTHADQLMQFEKQKQDAIRNAGQTTAGMAAEWNKTPSLVNKGVFAGLGGDLGKKMGKALTDALVAEVRTIPGRIADWAVNYGKSRPLDAIQKLFLPMFPQLSAAGKAAKIPGFATGGWVGGAPGQAQLAVVHGGEYVMSRDMIEGRQSAQVGGGGPLIGNVTYNVYNQTDLSAANADLGLRLRHA